MKVPRKAYVIAWINGCTLQVESVGVYSEEHPTQSHRWFGATLYVTQGETFGEAAEKAHEAWNAWSGMHPAFEAQGIGLT